MKLSFGILLHRKKKKVLIIPDYAPYGPRLYPGDIKPGYYDEKQVKLLLKKNKSNPQAIQFLRDMLEE